MKIKIENRSAWPTAAVKIIARWVCAREGLGKTEPYSVIVKSCKNGSFRGTGWRTKQVIKLDRNFRRPRHIHRPDSKPLWPYVSKDHRFQWSKAYEYRSRLEVLVMLLAHEAHHATAGRPKNFLKDGRLNADHMEFKCDEAAFAAVEAFRREWPELRTKIKAALRDERDLVNAKSDPITKIDGKRSAAESHLKRWQSKLKAASNKVKKYQRQVRYYEGRAAAMRGEKGNP